MKTGRPSRFVLFSAALVAAALAISACAPAAPLHTNSPGGHHVAAPSSPTPTPTATPASAPTPLVDTTCTDLASLSLVRQLLAEKGVVPTGYFTRYEYPEDATFTNVALRQLGGIGCYW